MSRFLISLLALISPNCLAFCLGSSARYVYNNGYNDHFLASVDQSCSVKSRKLVLSRPTMKIRGGAGIFSRSSSALEQEEEEDSNVDPQEEFRKRGMSIALACTYFSVMGAKCALPSVLSQLTNSKTGLKFIHSSATASSAARTFHAQQLMAALLALATLAVALGKLLLGPVIDYFGGIQSLRMSLIALMTLLGVISVTDQFSIFAVCWVLVDFIFSSCWAGCINAIHQSFPDSDWGKQIGRIAAGARLGNTAAFSLFAYILFIIDNRVNKPWKVVFLVSGLLQMMPIALLTYFGNLTTKATKARKKQEISSQDMSLEEDQLKSQSWSASLTTLCSEAKRPEFWFHLLSRSGLMVFASFLLFVPTLMNQVYGASNSVAAQVGSIYALGCLVSITGGSNRYARFSTRGKITSVVALLSMATVASLAQWAHVSPAVPFFTMSTSQAIAAIFLWGFSFAIPFYIPPSLYALERGGVQSSATISDIFDIAGFAALAIFNGYVASIQHSKLEAWVPTFIITTVSSITSLVSLSLAIFFESKGRSAKQQPIM